MRQHLSISIRMKRMSALNHARFQRCIILDDSVVNDGQIAAFTQMGVRIFVVGFSMGRPTCMAHPNGSRSVLP